MPLLEGEGVGPEVTAAMRRLVDQAVAGCYGRRRTIDWLPLELTRPAHAVERIELPGELLDTLRAHPRAIKGPYTTPVGHGHRSLNVELRRQLDLYCCRRPAVLRPGLSALPLDKRVEIVVFRELSEDVYCGIEYAAGSERARQLLSGTGRPDLDPAAAVGLKVMSRVASQRFFRRVLRWARDHRRRRVTIVHKGNIMKHTEGAFLDWCREVLAEEEFATHFRYYGERRARAEGHIVVDHCLADAMFQQLLARIEEYDVLAAPNLNGDYLAEAAGALGGSLALMPSANLGDARALFEPAHGTAPHLAGSGRANPTAMILAGCLLLEHAGWQEAAGALAAAIDDTLAAGLGTADLQRARQRLGRAGRELDTGAFVEAVVERLERKVA